MKKEETEETLMNIKTAAFKEVQNRRINLKRMIAEMREKQRRKTISLENRLQAVKYNMALKMKNAYKKGDMKFCVKIKNGEIKESRRNYCVANFSDDILNYQECLSTDDFCHFCCDNEFGDFNHNERRVCYKESCIINENENVGNLSEPEILMNSMM